MSEELVRRNWVIVMSGNLIGYADEVEITMIKQSIEKGIETIELEDGSIVQARNLAVLSPQAYDTFSRHQRGMWKCKYESWHSRDENCECGRQH
jgi:hypothetical protein